MIVSLRASVSEIGAHTRDVDVARVLERDTTVAITYDENAVRLTALLCHMTHRSDCPLLVIHASMLPRSSQFSYHLLFIVDFSSTSLRLHHRI